jgi:hypothetical protein
MSGGPNDMLSSPTLRARLADQAKLEDQRFEREQLARQIAADEARERALWNDHLYEVTHGHPRMGALELGLRAGEGWERDPSAPRGSERNPVVLY